VPNVPLLSLKPRTPRGDFEALVNPFYRLRGTSKRERIRPTAVRLVQTHIILQETMDQ
jgi:hypothetical protein